MITMLDKFMMILNESPNKNPIIIMRLKHRKYEIIKEIKSKEYYTPQDLCNYGWVILWAKTKWNENFVLPKNFEVRGVDNFYFYSYNPNGKTLFTITTKCFKSITEVQLNIHNTNGNVEIFHSPEGTYIDKAGVNTDTDWVNDIMREFLCGTISSILTRIIKGE